MTEPLPKVFEVELPDDAMAPKARKGQLVRFSTTDAARFGDGVLVIDGAGRWYFRTYTQGRGGAFVARAENDAFLSLDSSVDADITVAAVMVNVLQGRWT